MYESGPMELDVGSTMVRPNRGESYQRRRGILQGSTKRVEA